MDECVVSGCPICNLARFNPIGKNGPKFIVNHPVMDPIDLEAAIQPKVEPVRQETSCRTCCAPVGPSLPHPDCPQNQAARRGADKEKRKAARRLRQEEAAAAVEQPGEQFAQEVEEKADRQTERLQKGSVRRRDIVRDLLLKQSGKAQEQILSEMLLKIGANKETKDSVKIELTRPQGGRHLEVPKTFSH